MSKKTLQPLQVGIKYFIKLSDDIEVLPSSFQKKFGIVISTIWWWIQLQIKNINKKLNMTIEKNVKHFNGAKLVARVMMLVSCVRGAGGQNYAWSQLWAASFIFPFLSFLESSLSAEIQMLYFKISNRRTLYLQDLCSLEMWKWEEENSIIWIVVFH